MLYENRILTNKRTLEDKIYSEMVSHKVINDMIQILQKKMLFFFFSVCCIVVCWKSCIKSIHFTKWRTFLKSISEYLSVFSLNAGKHRPEKLPMQTLFWQWYFTLHVFTRDDRRNVHNFVRDLIPSLNPSELKEICLESFCAIFGCFPYRLIVVFSTNTVLRFHTL